MKNILVIFSLLVIIGCKKTSANENGSASAVTKVKLNKGAYLQEDTVIAEITLTEKMDMAGTLEEIGLRIVNISGQSKELYRKFDMAQLYRTDEKSKKMFLEVKLPGHFEPGAYGVYTIEKLAGKEAIETYHTFFRIIEKGELTVFDIQSKQFEGFPIFTLDGGMSAEYIVEKAAENLTSGISHSWEVNAPGSGPNHVLGTPDFLEKSVEQTVSFYDDALGDSIPIETVLVTPGFTSIPYISRSLNAVVLPLHFLVSVNTVKEIETILKTANEKDISSYATLSHDPSVPYAVAWVKLLSLPNPYIDFLKRHQVKNLVILGATGTSGGETKAKQLKEQDANMGTNYAPRSIYIMYPGTSPDDVETLNKKIVDLNGYKQQDDYIQIADWESGINPVQIQNFVSDGKSITNMNVSTILAEDLGHLYNLGTYTTIALMAKNRDKLGVPKGVIFNPYLISHPSYELKKGYVPLLYWQLVGADYTVDRMEHCAIRGINHYFPGASTENLDLWLNSTRNFGASWSADNLRKELKKRGFTNIKEGDYTVDEVWNPNDDMQASSELVLEDLKKQGYAAFKYWNDSLKPLSIDEFKNISEVFGGFQVESK